MEDVQTVKLTDIWGFSSDDIYACGTDYRAELYHFDGASWSLIIIGDTPPSIGQIQDPFYSFWGIDNRYKYLVGYYVYQNAIEDWENKLDFGYNIERIRGSSSNNVFAVGHLGGIAHFNGVDWNTYEELKDRAISYYSTFVTENKVFIVGQEISNSKLLIGSK